MSWAAVVGAVIAGGTSLYAQKQAKKKSSTDKALEGQLASNASTSGKFGEDMLHRSQESMDPVFQYYSQLARGDRESLAQLYAPEISAQSDAARQAFQTGTELSPRSGIDTAATSAIPMQNASQLARLFFGARPAGVEGLATLGTNLGSLGIAGLNQGGNAAGSLLGFNANRRAEQHAAGQEAGDSAYAIYKLFADMNNGKKSGGDASGGSFWNSSYKPKQVAPKSNDPWFGG